MVQAAAFQCNSGQKCHTIICHAQIGNVQLQLLDHGQNVEDLLCANGRGFRIVMQRQGCIFQILDHCQRPTDLGNVWDWTVYGEGDVDVFQCVPIHAKNIAQHCGDASIVAQCSQLQSLQWTALVQRLK